jgi:hypothetical protein
MDVKLEIVTSDPLGILQSTKSVVENAKSVFIDKHKLVESSAIIASRFNKGLSIEEMGYNRTGNLEKDVQFVFLEDVANFCFWASKGKPKWQVEMSDGKVTEGGWFGLKACFDRALAEKAPILEAKYLASFNISEAKSFFRGINNVEIPLLEERVRNLQEAGRVLLDKFDGKFINLLKAAGNDAVKIVSLIIENFPSFRDISKINGESIIFLKRAQICANDLSYIYNENIRIFNLEQLTAYADYKLPQMLRLFSILRYSKELASKVDEYIEVEHDTLEEVEIRAATIWAVELIRQQIPNLNAGNIDNTLWLMSQNVQKEAQPYHRTRTIYY